MVHRWYDRRFTGMPGTPSCEVLTSALRGVPKVSDSVPLPPPAQQAVRTDNEITMHRRIISRWAARLGLVVIRDLHQKTSRAHPRKASIAQRFTIRQIPYDRWHTIRQVSHKMFV
jgi:hypothetical protein